MFGLTRRARDNEWAIVPNFSNRPVVVANFSNEKVRSILNNIYEEKAVTPKSQKVIEKILSGKLWNNIKASEGN